MKLTVHRPVPSDIAGREDRLREKYPETSELLDIIKSETDRFKFGIRSSDIDRHYRFSDRLGAEAFFTERQKQFDDTELDLEAIRIATRRVLNVGPHADHGRRSSDAFKDIAERICGEIEQVKSVGSPYVSIVRGPTGSGKTAFSKCLFTAGLHVFWGRGLVPTRVEFSKFFKPGDSVSFESLLSAIHQSQIRDLIIFLAFSGTFDIDTDLPNKLVAIKEFGGQERNAIAEFSRAASSLRLDGERLTVSEAHSLWKRYVNYFKPTLCSAILTKVKQYFPEISFLVSLDGFDALKTRDFLTSDDYNGPIGAVADLLSSSLNQTANYCGSPSSHSTNLIVYMRETTYERVRLELHRTPNGERPTQLPVRWIVPPSYKMLTNSIAVAIDQTVSTVAVEGLTERFTKQVREALVKVITGPSLNVNTSHPITSAFSWNARHMKRHIRRVCIWSLENYLHNNEAEFLKERSRVSRSWLWSKTVSNPGLRSIHDYSVLETFFLDDTRSVQCKLKLNSRKIHDELIKGDVGAALALVSERTELVSLFDGILNYLTKGSEVEDGVCWPHTSVLVRILQILDRGRGAKIEDIFDFLRLLFPSISQPEVEFYVICLCENEYVHFRGSNNSTSISQCRFYISNFGKILLRRVFHSVTYFSQAMMLAELPRRGLGEELRALDYRGIEHWLCSCVYNSIIAFNIWERLESREISRLSVADQDPSLYLSRDLRKSLVDEISKIFSVRGRSEVLSNYYKSLPESLGRVKSQRGIFDAFDELWGAADP
jgi:hypothetical protein